MTRGYRTIFFLIAVLLLPGPSGAVSLDGFLDAAGQALQPKSNSDPTDPESLKTNEIIAGLKEALDVAIDRSVDSLGRPGGYLNSPEVRIPMPGYLAKAETLARAAGQGELVDAFVASMNSAAEQAVPETMGILSDAVQQMRFADAKAILNGPQDAATQYFRRTSSDALLERIRPIVSQAMEQVGVTRRYKALTTGIQALGPLLDAPMPDLDDYVTQEAVEGLFAVMADEEAKIRKEPVARTSALLRKVFGSRE
ncbi:MAG: DUF4197 domain-containing protein [Desulfovibrio sp.]|jgi:hypothetical protein